MDAAGDAAKADAGKDLQDFMNSLRGHGGHHLDQAFAALHIENDTGLPYTNTEPGRHVHRNIAPAAGHRNLIPEGNSLSTDKTKAPNVESDAPHQDEAATAIAATFTQARAAGRALADFPGEIPEDLVAAYGVQDIAIGRWPDEVIGWKVGFIPADRRDGSGDDRLLGPIFKRAFWPAEGCVDFPVYAGGFAAVEAEYVLRLEADAPADKIDWTPEEAAALPARLFTGIEVASSPLATINQLGPRVVISDFGNHNGLILGNEIPGWLDIPEDQLRAETLIDGETVGTGGATTLPGGLRTAYAFALARSARRGRPLKAGALIATGNATGIHDILTGQVATVRFAGHGEIQGRAVAAKPGTGQGSGA